MADDTTAQPDIEGLELRRDGAVLWITIDREKRGNSLTPDMRNGIIDVLGQAQADHDVRAIVLTAAGGRFFCTGADVSGGAAKERVSGDVRHMIRTGAQRLFEAIWTCEKPIVCGLNGTAAGIGAHIAMACDLVVASRSSKLIEIFARRGLLPDGGGAYLLPRLIGPQKAKELMFFADDVPAARAEDLGLVNTVVDPDDLTETLTSWANRLAEGPTRSYAYTKWLVNNSLDQDREAALNAEASFVEVNMGSRDMQEGMKAFVERRDPTFNGR